MPADIRRLSIRHTRSLVGIAKTTARRLTLGAATKLASTTAEAPAKGAAAATQSVTSDEGPHSAKPSGRQDAVSAKGAAASGQRAPPARDYAAARPFCAACPTEPTSSAENTATTKISAAIVITVSAAITAIAVASISAITTRTQSRIAIGADGRRRIAGGRWRVVIFVRGSALINDWRV